MFLSLPPPSNLVQTESNLIEDGMEDAIILYNKKKNKTKKKSSKKKSPRAKTPVRRTSSRKATSSKKASSKKASSKKASSKKASSKKASSKKASSNKAKDSPAVSAFAEANDDFDSESESESDEDPVVAYANSSSPNSTTASSSSSSSSPLSCSNVFGSSYFYWYVPYMMISAIVLYTMLVLTPEYYQTLPCPSGNAQECKASNEAFINVVGVVHKAGRLLAPMVAFFGISAHNHQNAFTSNISAGLVWHVAAILLPMCDVDAIWTDTMHCVVLGTCDFLCGPWSFVARRFGGAQDCPSTDGFGCCLLFVVCCLLFVVCCLLFVFPVFFSMFHS